MHTEYKVCLIFLKLQFMVKQKFQRFQSFSFTLKFRSLNESILFKIIVELKLTDGLIYLKINNEIKIFKLVYLQMDLRFNHIRQIFAAKPVNKLCCLP